MLKLAWAEREIFSNTKWLWAVSRTEKAQLTQCTDGRPSENTPARHTNPRYPTRPKDVHLENLENACVRQAQAHT